ncbi:MAG: VanZ family protein [Vicinamibacterales bacterium]
MSAPESAAGPSAFSLWAPVVAYMSLVFGLSAMSSPPSPIHVNDKIEHFVFYGGLALVALRATAGGRVAGVTTRALIAAWAIASFYGATDEFHQWFVPGRSADVADWLADTFGAATAMGVAMQGAILLRSRRASRA